MREREWELGSELTTGVEVWGYMREQFFFLWSVPMGLGIFGGKTVGGFEYCVVNFVG